MDHDPQPTAPATEGIRSWYQRTTRRAVRAIVWSTVLAAAIAVVGFLWAPRDWTLHAQVFNGAWTIPAFGGIWLASFILIWLVPMREVSFRGQESMEKMGSQFDVLCRRVTDMLDRAEKGQLPALLRIERKFDEGIQELRELRVKVGASLEIAPPDPSAPDPLLDGALDPSTNGRSAKPRIEIRSERRLDAGACTPFPAAEGSPPSTSSTSYLENL